MSKTLFIIGFIIIVLVGAFYYLGQKGGEVTALDVQVKVKVNNGNLTDVNSATIEDISGHLKTVKKMSEPKGTLLIVPGITVVVIQNEMMIGSWTSVPYNGTGVYDMTVGLTKYPKPGENISVIARVMNSKSENIAVASKNVTIV